MKNIILVVFICASSLVFGQKIECQNFKNGKFKIIDPEIGNSVIERSGSKQIEYSEDLKLKLEFDVKWLNDCTYKLELSEILENRDNIKLPEEMILTIEIIETKQHSYIQKTSSNIYDMVLESELIQID